jgi:hypothetical protein
VIEALLRAICGGGLAIRLHLIGLRTSENPLDLHRLPLSTSSVLVGAVLIVAMLCVTTPLFIGIHIDRHCGPLDHSWPLDHGRVRRRRRRLVAAREQKRRREAGKLDRGEDL